MSNFTKFVIYFCFIYLMITLVLKDRTDAFRHENVMLKIESTCKQTNER